MNVGPSAARSVGVATCGRTHPSRVLGEQGLEAHLRGRVEELEDVQAAVWRWSGGGGGHGGGDAYCRLRLRGALECGVRGSPAKSDAGSTHPATAAACATPRFRSPIESVMVAKPCSRSHPKMRSAARAGETSSAPLWPVGSSGQGADVACRRCQDDGGKAGEIQADGGDGGGTRLRQEPGGRAAGGASVHPRG